MSDTECECNSMDSHLYQSTYQVKGKSRVCFDFVECKVKCKVQIAKFAMQCSDEALLLRCSSIPILTSTFVTTWRFMNWEKMIALSRKGARGLL